MTAIVTFTMMATIMTLAAAVMALTMMMVGTDGVRIEGQPSLKQCFHSLISIAGDTRIELDASLSQSRAGTAADAAANQGISAQHLQKTSQCTMSASTGSNHLAGTNGTILYLIDLEQLAVSKVLEYLSILISYCNFQRNFLPFPKNHSSSRHTDAGGSFCRSSLLPVHRGYSLLHQ